MFSYRLGSGYKEEGEGRCVWVNLWHFVTVLSCGKCGRLFGKVDTSACVGSTLKCIHGGRKTGRW